MSLTFACATQTVNINDHIVARFDAGTLENPDDTSVCRLTVWHEGGEATVTTFQRNGLVISTTMFEPPAQQSAKASAAAPAAADDKKGAKK